MGFTGKWKIEAVFKNKPPSFSACILTYQIILIRVINAHHILPHTTWKTCVKLVILIIFGTPTTPKYWHSIGSNPRKLSSLLILPSFPRQFHPL